MSVDKETVHRIARLARIALSEEQVTPMVDELNGILGWIEQLKDADIAGVPPLASVAAQPLSMRDDVVTEVDNSEALMANAPLTEDRFFVVPKVVE